MLRDAQALLAMMKDQEKALVDESVARVQRDEAMIKVIKEDSVAWQINNDIMLENCRIAIKRIEGPEEVNHG